VLRKDVNKFQRRGPGWKETAEDKQKLLRRGSNEANLRRSGSMFQVTFIMDIIKSLAGMENDRYQRLIDEKFQDTRFPIADADLIAPWLEIRAIADRVATEEGNDRKKRDLKRIEDHVQFMYNEHKLQRQPTKKAPSDKRAAFSDFRIEIRQEKLRQLSKEFFSIPCADELEFSERERARLLASYAYYYDSQQRKKWSRFPWDLAMRELCAIKAHKDGLSKTVSIDFYERFILKVSSLHNKI
jgi:RNA-dependent RNA polymerase